MIRMNISRRTLRLAFFLTICAVLSSLASAADKYLFYVGTYTEGTQSKGIYAYRFDPRP